jgi:hypothetical protein
MSTDEEKISRLYQQGTKKNNHEAPSAQLDSAILKAAHQAIEKPSTARSPFSGGWPAATSIAAVLIITVILVPLIKQESPPAITEMADETQELMLEQDDIGRLDAEITEIKAKKRTSAKMQERRVTKAPPEAPPEAPLKAPLKALRYDQPFAEEETIAPMRAIPALPSAQQAKPVSAAAGKATIQPYKQKSELKSEPQQLNRHGLAADNTSSATLTPEMWLKKIQQLIDQNELDLALEELDRFRTHYPDEEIEASILNSFKQ